jgi:hypothetical protein
MSTAGRAPAASRLRGNLQRLLFQMRSWCCAVSSRRLPCTCRGAADDKHWWVELEGESLNGGSKAWRRRTSRDDWTAHLRTCRQAGRQGAWGAAGATVVSRDLRKRDSLASVLNRTTLAPSAGRVGRALDARQRLQVGERLVRQCFWCRRLARALGAAAYQPLNDVVAADLADPTAVVAAVNLQHRTQPSHPTGARTQPSHPPCARGSVAHASILIHVSSCCDLGALLRACSGCVSDVASTSQPRRGAQRGGGPCSRCVPLAPELLAWLLAWRPQPRLPCLGCRVLELPRTRGGARERPQTESGAAGPGRRRGVCQCAYRRLATAS